VKIPNFQLIGKYNADGKVLVLPIKGSGDSNLTLGKPNFILCVERRGYEHL